MSLGSNVDVVYGLFPLTAAALPGLCIVMHNKAEAKYMYMFTLSFAITRTHLASCLSALFFNCVFSKEDPLALSEHTVAESPGAIKDADLRE